MTTVIAPEPIPTAAAWSRARVLSFLLPLALFYASFVGMTPEWTGSNEGSYLYASVALYERGTPVIDEEVKRFGKHEDLARRGGHYYSNKPPGLLFFLVAVCPLIDLVGPGRLTGVELIYFGRLLVVTLPFVGFLYLLGRQLERLARPSVAWGLVLAYGLASGAAVYATLLFSHGLVTALHGAAFILLWRPSARRCAAAGALSAFGVISEYQSVVIFAVLAAAAACGPGERQRWRFLACFLLGALPAVVLAAGYHALCFEKAYQLPYAFNKGIQVRKKPYGIGWPSLEALYGLLLSPSRGFLFFTAWMALAYASTGRVLARWRDSRDSRLLGLCLAAPVLSMTALASYVYWHGGMSVGPRYLLTAAHFLLYPLAVLLGRDSPRRAPWVFLVCAGVTLSAAVHLLTLVSFPMAPWMNQHPFLNTVSVFCLEALRRGYGTYTVANHFGASVEASRILMALFVAWIVLAYARHGWKSAAPAVRAACLGGALCGLALFPLWLSVGTADTRPIRDFRAHFHKSLYHQDHQEARLRNR